MRKVGGLLLISLGVGMLSIYAVVKFPLLFPEAVIHRITTHEIIVYVASDTPIWGSVALLAGVLLVRSKRRIA